jgi:hypothetical protein
MKHSPSVPAAVLALACSATELDFDADGWLLSCEHEGGGERNEFPMRDRHRRWFHWNGERFVITRMVKGRAVELRRFGLREFALALKTWEACCAGITDRELVAWSEPR